MNEIHGAVYISLLTYYVANEIGISIKHGDQQSLEIRMGGGENLVLKPNTTNVQEWKTSYPKIEVYLKDMFAIGCHFEILN